MLRLLSSRTTYGAVPIWSCRQNNVFLNASPLSLMALAANPKPTSMSPFLGVRYCSTLEPPKQETLKTPITPSIPDSKPLEVTVEVIQGIVVHIPLQMCNMKRKLYLSY